MFLSSRGTFALVIILSIYTVLQAQSGNGVNSTGTAGNEIIQGKIYFPSGHKSNMRPVVKLQSDSSSELTTVANFDGSFSFTHLRPDSYKIIVNGGDEFENAFETVSVGSAGPVPAQGNPGQYAMPVIYQVQIYLQPKRTLGFDPSDSATRAALANVPKTARDLFNKALESARLGQSKKAIEQFKQAISQAPNFALAYNEMGTLYLKLGRADEAVDALAAAVKLEPEQFAARLNYGIALLNLNKFADAEKELRQALQKNGAAPIAHYYLGLTLMKQREFDSAQAEFETSIRNSKDGIALAHKYLGGIYWHNKLYGRAADELERYIVLVRKAPDAAKIRDTIKDLRSKQ
jgi:Tfp pilus assembly protein PilF